MLLSEVGPRTVQDPETGSHTDSEEPVGGVLKTAAAGGARQGFHVVSHRKVTTGVHGVGKPPGGNPQGITRDVSGAALEPRVPRGQDYVLEAVRSQEICMSVLQDRLYYESQGMRKRDRRKGARGEREHADDCH